MTAPISTRDRIIDEAIDQFWRYGYHEVSIQMICQALAIRKGSLHYAFPSKAELLRAALDRVWARNWAAISAIYERPGIVEAQFREHMAWFATSQRDLKARQGVVLGTFDMSLGVSLPDEIFAEMARHSALHHERLLHSIMSVAGIGPADRSHGEWITAIVSHLLVSHHVQARRTNSIAVLEALPDTVLRLVRHLAVPMHEDAAERHGFPEDIAAGNG